MKLSVFNVHEGPEIGTTLKLFGALDEPERVFLSDRNENGNTVVNTLGEKSEGVIRDPLGRRMNRFL